MGIHKMGYTFSPSPDALSRVGLSQRERRQNEPLSQRGQNEPLSQRGQNEPLSLWERGRGEGQG
jgi:hypothetical protein